MPFVDLDTPRKPRGASLVRARVLNHGFAVRLEIGRNVADEFSLATGGDVNVLWGTGVDFGWVALDPVARSGQTLEIAVGGLALEFRTFPKVEIDDANGTGWHFSGPFGRRARGRDAAEVDYRELTNGSMAVRLPDNWFSRAPSRSRSLDDGGRSEARP